MIRTLAAAALFYESLSIVYTGLFFLITHLFVVLYEKPTLRRTFGDEIRSVFPPGQALTAAIEVSEMTFVRRVLATNAK
jgi:hypothetical protein